MLYPLKFIPRLVRKMWGGRKLEELLHKQLPPQTPFGESWELYDFPPGATGPDAMQPKDDPKGWISSRIANGPLAGHTLHELIKTHPRELLGECQPVETSAGPQFPLLIKFLDAHDDLSVQVHPPPEYAARHENSFVKNEAWHILAHEHDARLLLGAKPGVTPEQFKAALERGDVEPLINPVPVARGETYYLPSGTLHALGGGIVAYEVQTPSDTTYRVFDFNRIEAATGKPRTLHVQQALDCILWELDATRNKTPRHTGDAVLARAPQWLLMQVELRGTDACHFAHPGGFIAATILHGQGAFASHGAQESFGVGETILLPPAGQTRVLPSQACRMLLACVPPMGVEELRPR